jgi:shikimate kinase
VSRAATLPRAGKGGEVPPCSYYGRILPDVCLTLSSRGVTLKLKRTPGVFLVGFMAIGKSTVGRALADEIGWPFVDIDEEIERSQGKTIAQLFIERGEKAFREIETEMIRAHVSQIRSGVPSVIALGGGAFVQPQNWELISESGITVWLDCPFETLCSRLGNNATRPLAADRAKLAQLFQDRRPLYSRADYRVEVHSGDVSDVVESIRKLPLF